MFAERFSGYAGETITCEVDGFTATATLHFDGDHGAPWEEECGHGPVSDWTRRDKLPGEFVLNEDRGSKRFYDFAGAVKIARRDGWGWLPGPLVTKRNSGGKWHAWIGRDDGTGECLFNTGGHDDVNAAIRAVYAAHRATMTPRQYAAGAAMADFKRLRDWINDQWQYVGVAVTIEREDVQLTGPYDHALWGIESDSGEYLTEVANENLEQALEAAREKVAALSRA